MNLFRKMTATTAIVAIASGLFVSGVSAASNVEVENANYLANEGIIVNHADEPVKYELNRNVLRQEIAAVARGVAKLPKTTVCNNTFSDVSATKPNTWACYTVEALRNNGLIAGNKTFRPESYITKSEAIGMVVKACKGDEYAYDASKPGNWQEQVVEYAANNAYITRFTDYNALATRGFIFSAAANCYKAKYDNAAIDIKSDICKILGSCDEIKTTDKKDDKKEVTVVGQDKAVVRLAPQSPTDGLVAENSSRTPVLAFEITAGNTDVTLERANLKFTGLGDAKILNDLAIYSNDVKVSKGNKTFNSKNEANVSFDRDTVVKAGETKTFVVTSTVKVPAGKTFNQNLRVALTGIEASSPVEGANLVGANLVPTLVSNKAKVDYDASNSSGRMELGKVSTLYNFSLRETEKKEDVLVKSVTFEAADANTFDLDYLSDLVLSVDGKAINANFTIKRTKVVATFDYTIKAGTRANFKLEGAATDDLNKKLALKVESDGVYMVGAATGISLALGKYQDMTVTKTIEGSAVNFTFVENTAKEVGIDTYDAQIGTLTFTANAEYNADMEIVLKGTEKTIKGIGTSLEINGESGVKTDVSATEVKFAFKDIYLKKGSNALPLTVDIDNNADADSRLTVTVKVNSLEDDSLGEKVTNLQKTLNNSEITRSVLVKAPELKLITKKVDNTKVVPKNSQRVVLYKGEINVSNSENLTIESMDFVKASNSENLEDYLSNATLNIGGKTFNGEINNGSIAFTSVFAEIQKGARSVEVLVTGTLRDKEIDAQKTLAIELNSDSSKAVKISADNARSPKTVIAGGNESTIVTLTQSGQLLAESNTANNTDDTVLAGTNGVTLAKFKLRAEFEDLDIKTLDIVANGVDLRSIGGLKLMDGTKELASGGTVTYDNTNSTVRFENFTLPSTSEFRNVTLVGDLARFNDNGGSESAFIGNVKFSKVDFVLNNTSATTGTQAIQSNTVSVVPAIVKISKTSDLFGENDAKAVVKVNVEKGDNSISTLTLLGVKFEANDKVKSVQVNNDSAVNYTDPLNIDITDKSSFDLTITLKGGERLNNFRLDDMKFKATTGTKVEDFNSVKFNSDLGSYFETN